MLNKTFLVRLLLDGIAAGLLLVALAYYWLGNTVHELAGASIFVLLVIHNIFNRRWYAVIIKPLRDRRSRIDRVLTLCLLAVVVALLVTSLLISKTLFSFLPMHGGFNARQIHTFAAYWSVALVAIHLGIRWERVMHAARSALDLPARSMARTAALRLIAAAIALHGLWSSAVMGIGTKLMFQMSLDGWDFDASTPGFFLHWFSIAGLYVSVTHYMFMWVKRKGRRTPLESHGFDAPPEALARNSTQKGPL